MDGRRERTGEGSRRRRIGPPVFALALTVAAIAPAIAPALAAAEPAPSYSAAVEVTSRYVWHGLAFSDGPAAQPEAWIEWSGLSFGLWASVPLVPSDEGIAELDPILAYELEWRDFTITPGLEAYLLAEGFGDSTGMATLEVGYPIGPIELFTREAIDAIGAPGAFLAEAGARAERTLARAPAFTVSGEVLLGAASPRFNELYVGPSVWALDAGGLDVGLAWRPRAALELRLHGGVTALVDGRLRDAVRAAEGSPTIPRIGLAIGVEL